MKCPCCRREIEQSNEVIVSLDTNTVTYRGNILHLMPRQAEILHVLRSAMPGACDREEIIRRVWSVSDIDDADNQLSVQVCKLRKLLLPLGLKILTTNRRGYILSSWLDSVVRAVGDRGFKHRLSQILPSSSTVPARNSGGSE